MKSSFLLIHMVIWKHLQTCIFLAVDVCIDTYTQTPSLLYVCTCKHTHRSLYSGICHSRKKFRISCLPLLLHFFGALACHYLSDHHVKEGCPAIYQILHYEPHQLLAEHLVYQKGQDTLGKYSVHIANLVEASLML